ncbi:MAG: hypothetical protein K2Q13_05725 [Nitrosomonas sp.]|uniref:hypothetical protein n=1 Tax=Nitrosomonas sp. TaxID=42353 RepID=UPI0025EEE560|nr:hypothetical protein [Nitrosomonas sp.]MBY0474544.1 hypothetical protein [Nitrosomonas sp.]
MKQIFIESSFSSFADFHDDKWYEKLFSLSEGLAIESAVEDFSSHWWGASRAFVLPWFLVSGVFEASNGGGGEVTNKQELWDKYLHINSFKGALWKAAEGAYGAVYYAYENLVVNILNADRKSPCRVTQRDFNSIVSESFGNSVASKVWSNGFVAVSKEVRNCLVHRGGKASPALLKMKPLPMIEGADILISASDARMLHEQLKPKVVLLIEHYAKNGGRSRIEQEYNR